MGLTDCVLNYPQGGILSPNGPMLTAQGGIASDVTILPKTVADGIQTVDADLDQSGEVYDQGGEVYDLSGRKYDALPNKSGIYIKNGKKVIVK